MSNCRHCKPYCNYAVLDCGCPCHRAALHDNRKQQQAVINVLKAELAKLQPAPHESNFGEMMRWTEQHTQAVADYRLQLD